MSKIPTYSHSNKKHVDSIRDLLNYTSIDKREVSGEQALWKSVIMQAALDVINTPRNTRERIQRVQTIAWFSKQNKDFMMVCAFADMDPDHMINGIKKILQHSKKPIRRRFQKNSFSTRQSLLTKKAPRLRPKSRLSA